MFQKKNPPALRIVGVVLLVAIVFGTGFSVGGHTEKKRLQALMPDSNSSGLIVEHGQEKTPLIDPKVDFSMFWDIWRIVKTQHFGEQIDDQKLLYGALSGIVSALKDPYSVFFDPETTKKFNDELAGTFQGIGAEIGMKKDLIVVVAPLPNSPAERAGIHAGDVLLAIDDKETGGMSTDAAVSLIRGKKGTVVKLTIYREGLKEPKEIAITRDDIKMEAVTWKLTDRIAYIKIAHFNADTTPMFGRALKELLPQNPKGLIVDLRNDPGGYLDSAVEVTSEWVPKGSLIVVQHSSDTEEEQFTSEKNPRLEHMPTVVLINGGSASASEIMSGALQDYGKATLVGEKTFGKGSVQNYEPLRDGSSIKITIAEWLTPKRRMINKQGIEPDIKVERTREDYEANRDPQLDRAMSILKEKK